MRLSRCAPLLLVLALVGLGVGTVRAQTEAESEVSSPDATVYVDGLACPFCAYGLEKKMKRLDALRKMEVQLEKGRVLLAFKKGRRLTQKQIQNAVKEAGFTARKIEFDDEAPS